MNQSTLDQLTMSLKDYNATAYKLMETISGSMEKVAILLLLLFMGINLMNWHQHLKSNGGELSFQLWIEEILKYAIAKAMLQFIYWVVDFVGQISTKLLILLRSFTLYTYKGIAKIIVACYMVDSLRPICLGFFKLYAAAVLQGLILVVVIMLYPAIVTNDLLTVDKTGAWTSALIAIAKGIIYIVMLFGSQRMAKNIMQVN